MNAPAHVRVGCMPVTLLLRRRRRRTSVSNPYEQQLRFGLGKGTYLPWTAALRVHPHGCKGPQLSERGALNPRIVSLRVSMPWTRGVI
jgi:hypothetical protein